MGSAQGAFATPSVFKTVHAAKADSYQASSTDGDGIDFKASRDNAAYDGSKLQVSALQFLPCIRC